MHSLKIYVKVKSSLINVVVLLSEHVFADLMVHKIQWVHIRS